MAKRLAIPSKEFQLFLVGKLESFKAPRIQRLSINTDVPSTTVDEIGNSSHVGDVKDIPNVTLTFSAMDVGTKIFGALAGVAQSAFTSGVDISSLGEVDAVLYVKDAVAATYVKSAHAKRLQVRDMTFNYSVDGESTEDYTVIGSEKRWFKNSVQVDVQTAGATSYTLSQTPVALKNGNKLATVRIGGSYLVEAAAAAAGFYSVSGTTVTVHTDDKATAGDSAVFVYQTSVAGTFTDVSDTTMPAAIRGRDVKMYIAANDIPRVQSLTVNATLNVQPVREMGTRTIIGYQRQVPEVTGTITVLDTDTELINLLMNGSLSADTEFAPGEGCVASGIALYVQMIDPCDTVAPLDVKKTVYLDSITVVGDSITANVNQNISQTFNWKSITGHCKVYSGAYSG
jgi:hypothetical protein